MCAATGCPPPHHAGRHQPPVLRHGLLPSHNGTIPVPPPSGSNACDRSGDRGGYVSVHDDLAKKKRAMIAPEAASPA
jgi:hypothetical protein